MSRVEWDKIWGQLDCPIDIQVHHDECKTRDFDDMSDSIFLQPTRFNRLSLWLLRLAIRLGQFTVTGYRYYDNRPLGGKEE